MSSLRSQVAKVDFAFSQQVVIFAFKALLSPCSELLLPFVNFAQGLRPESAFTFSNANFLLGLHFRTQVRQEESAQKIPVFPRFFQPFSFATSISKLQSTLDLVELSVTEKYLQFNFKGQNKGFSSDDCNLILLAGR